MFHNRHTLRWARTTSSVSSPIEPAATISSMGEVAAAVQPEVDLTPPPEPVLQPQPATEQSVPAEATSESIPAAVEPNPPGTPAQAVVSNEAVAEPEAEQSAETKSPMDLLAKLLRGESARPDES